MDISYSMSFDQEKVLYVGDICYSMKRDIYDNFWGKFNYEVGVYNVPANVVGNNNGSSFMVHDTEYGDGTYSSKSNFSYSVDAGVIGVVPSDLAKNKEEIGSDLVRVTTGKNVEMIYEDGTFTIIIDNKVFDIIYTDYSDEDEDEEEYEDEYEDEEEYEDDDEEDYEYEE